MTAARVKYPAALQRRIEEVRIAVMEQMKENMDNYVWKSIRSLDDLENTRVSAMNLFLEDYEIGKKENRYICHELPDKVPFENDTFDMKKSLLISDGVIL